jgi:hypothetical protein
MESTVKVPQVGDVVFVFAKMKSGKITELSGSIEHISNDYAYFALDAMTAVPKTTGVRRLRPKYGRRPRPNSRESACQSKS